MVMDMADSPKDQRKIVKLYEKYIIPFIVTWFRWM